MKLNPDCIRDVLFELEKQEYDTRTHINDLTRKLTQYSAEDVKYSCLKLFEGGYITGKSSLAGNKYIPLVDDIFDITYKGHEFLNTIRPVSRWNKLKSIGSTAGSFSLKLIKDVGTKIALSEITEFIKNVD